MSEGVAGRFWLAEAPGAATTGRLVEEEGSWRLILNGTLFASSANSTIETSNGQLLQTLVVHTRAQVDSKAANVRL